MFLVFFVGSWWFLVVLVDCLWVLVVLGGSWWLLVFIGGYWCPAVQYVWFGWHWRLEKSLMVGGGCVHKGCSLQPLSICRLCPLDAVLSRSGLDFYNGHSGGARHWSPVVLTRQWIRDVTAHGCLYYSREN